MPVVPRNIVEILKNTDESSRTRPFTFHGIELQDRGSESVGTCPFCQKDKKFYVANDTTKWQCKVCGAEGNPTTFLRTLWEQSSAVVNAASKAFAAERKVDPYTLNVWGVCQSVIDGTWLVPGYDTNGKLYQLYRRARFFEDRAVVWRLLPTPGIYPDGRVHAIHMASTQFDSARPDIDVCEGPWDGMAFWEVARQSKWVDGRLELTGNETNSLLVTSNVIAIPGANAFMDWWLPLFRDKNVRLWFDNDHPNAHALATSGKVLRAGFDGMYRAAKRLSGIAKSVQFIRWGKEGYDSALKSGYDVRDHLTQASDRRTAFVELCGKLQPAPSDWFSANATTHINGTSRSFVPKVESEQCNMWGAVEAAWKDAQEWRLTASDVLTTMLAVCASTQQAGKNQLFLQVIGSASGGKTTFCDALLVSRSCHLMDHITGLYSGWKKPGDNEKDCSLLARINGKTLITPEGDTMMSSPKFDEVMSQFRRVFDGTGSATYKNDDQDRVYEGMRTPWIMAGTLALLDKDQSRLGDRFIRVMMDDPTDDEKRRITRRALRNEMSAMRETSNGTAASVLDENTRRAYALTGGYVDWLRDNIETQLADVVVPEWAEDRIIQLGELTADLRARPNTETRKHDTHDIKEMPYRLSAQMVRLAQSIAVVRNKREVDRDVMRIIRKVAIDTSHGHSLNIVRWLCSRNPKMPTALNQDFGLMVGILSGWTGMKEERLVGFLSFLRSIDVLKQFGNARDEKGYWKLTDRVFNLYTSVMKD